MFALPWRFEPPLLYLTFLPSERNHRRPLGMNALSLMLTRRYHAGGGTLPYFGSDRIRHGSATLLANGVPDSRRGPQVTGIA